MAEEAVIETPFGRIQVPRFVYSFGEPAVVGGVVVVDGPLADAVNAYAELMYVTGWQPHRDGGFVQVYPPEGGRKRG